MKKALKGALLWAVTIALPVAAGAQSLANEPCKNALYHFEDALNNPAYYKQIISGAPSQAICVTSSNGRQCVSGPQSAAEFLDSVRQNNVDELIVRRIGLVPEHIGETRYACVKTGNGRYRIGFAYERMVLKNPALK
ncbi:MAG: hypothetical protein AAGK00_20070 [Pseudomonadota bacterium]